MPRPGLCNREIEILREVYPAGGSAAVWDRFEAEGFHRSRGAISMWAQRLKVRTHVRARVVRVTGVGRIREMPLDPLLNVLHGLAVAHRDTALQLRSRIAAMQKDVTDFEAAIQRQDQVIAELRQRSAVSCQQSGMSEQEATEATEAINKT